MHFMCSFDTRMYACVQYKPRIDLIHFASIIQSVFMRAPFRHFIIRQCMKERRVRPLLFLPHLLYPLYLLLYAFV